MRVVHFFFCTLAATFRRRAFSRMKPVASSWLYAFVGSASIVAMCGLYRLTGLLRPATMMLPLYSFTRTVPVTFFWLSVTSACNAYRDRKSTRLNSSHLGISYAVFCLKKKTKNNKPSSRTIKQETPSEPHKQVQYT